MHNLFHRASIHCNATELLKTEGQTFKLITYGYPETQTRTPGKKLKRTISKTITLLYMREDIKKYRPSDKTVGYPNRLQSALFNGKGHVDYHDQPGIVYPIPCTGCGEHISETNKRQCTCLHENKLALRRGDPRSQIWNHCARTGHEVQIDNGKVIPQAK